MGKYKVGMKNLNFYYFTGKTGNNTHHLGGIDNGYPFQKK